MDQNNYSLKHSPAECYWRLERDVILQTLQRIEAKVDKNADKDSGDHDDIMVLKTKWALLAVLAVFLINLFFVLLKVFKIGG